MRSAIVAVAATALAGCATAGPESVHGPRTAAAWRELISDGFVLQTNLGPAEAEAVIVQLERIRARLLRVMPIQPRMKQAPLQVVCFATRQQLEEYLPPAGSGAASIFHRDAAGRERILLPGDLGKWQQRAIAHEVAHYLMFYAVVRQPRWFGEGTATWLEAAVSGGLPEPRLLARLQRGPLPVRAIFDWTEDLDEEPLPRYATSWLLVHFLARRRPSELSAFQERLANAEDPTTAWNAVFGEWSLELQGGADRLDQAMLAYWKGGIPPWSAPEVELEPRFSQRLLSPSEVHALRLELPRSWTADQLRAEISEALADDPGHVGALMAQASVDPRSAPGLARRAVAAHPDDPRAWSFLAATLGGEAHAEERETALRKALSLAPDRLEATMALALDLLAQSRVEEALALSARAVELAPWSPFALFVRGRVLSAAGRCQEALSTARHAVDVLGHNVKPEARDRVRRDASDLERKCGSREAMSAYALTVKSAEASRREDHQQAAALLEGALALDPRDRAAWSALGIVYRRLGRSADAVAAFKKQLEVVPDHGSAWNGLGLALQDEGRFAEAEVAFRRQIEIVPDDRAALSNLGRLLHRVGRPKDALAPLEKLVRLEPRNVTALVLRAKARIASGDQDDGVAALDHALKIAPGPFAQNQVAYALAETGVRLDRAVELARSALAAQNAFLQVNPAAAGESELMRTQSLLAAWDTLGWALYRMGRLADAERYVAGAERLRDSAEVSDHLGQILESLGRREEAIRAYARALASPLPAFETRGRIAALIGESEVEAAIRRGREDLAALRTLTVERAPPSADPEVDVLLVLRRDGSLASVRPTVGATLPAGAERLLGRRIQATLPDDSQGLLVLRARFSCSAAACRAELGRARTSAAPAPRP